MKERKREKGVEVAKNERVREKERERRWGEGARMCEVSKSQSGTELERKNLRNVGVSCNILREEYKERSCVM